MFHVPTDTTLKHDCLHRDRHTPSTGVRDYGDGLRESTRQMVESCAVGTPKIEARTGKATFIKSDDDNLSIYR